MTGFEGLENAGLIEGPQEKATREFIKEYRDGKAENPMADFIYSSMLSIARNIDVQNARGREISRNMTSLLAISNSSRACTTRWTTTPKSPNCWARRRDEPRPAAILATAPRDRA